MEWHKELYLGKSVRQRQRKVKWKIMHRAWQLRVYVITFASNEKNLLDIIPSWELMQKHYPKQGLYIIGLAGHIINDVYQATGGFDVRGYLRQRGKQGI